MELVGRNLYYPIVIALVGALLLRRRAAERKRLAVVEWAALLVALRVCAWLFVRLSIPEFLYVIPVAAAAVFVYTLRSHFLPLRLRCATCGTRLGFARMLASDENLCARCDAERGEPRGGDGALPPRST